jgi:hypothetical protein
MVPSDVVGDPGSGNALLGIPAQPVRPMIVNDAVNKISEKELRNFNGCLRLQSAESTKTVKKSQL